VNCSKIDPPKALFKCTKCITSLTAELRPDPLGKLKLGIPYPWLEEKVEINEGERGK